MKVSGASNAGELRPLTSEDLPQALSYVAADPLRNLVLIGFLKGAGTSEPHGEMFFSFWKDGLQKGVGLLGSTAAWTGGAEVAQALGEKARESGNLQFRTVMGPAHEVEVFLHASQDGRSGETETHLLYVLRRVDLNSMPGDVSLRAARPEECEELFRIHMDLYLELSGRPLPGPETSKQRLLRRIEAGRIWIACQRDKIVFKADVATETVETALIEAVWTSPDLRGQGIGAKALSALCSHLLVTYPTVCLFLGNDRSRLERFYERIGFRHYDEYGDWTVVRY